MYKRKVWFIVVPLFLFLMLSISVKAGLTVHFESWAYNEAVEKIYPLKTAFLKAVSHLGNTAAVASFCLLLFFIPKSRVTIALPVSVCVLASTALNLILKHLFVRERPDILRLINETSYSFPSGHAMINASLYMLLILLIFKFIRNIKKKLLLSSVCLLMIYAIGYSRVYLGVHFAGDVLGGYLLGMLTADIVYILWHRRFEQAVLRRQPHIKPPTGIRSFPI